MGKGPSGVALWSLVLFLENGFKESVRSGGHEQMGKQCVMAQQASEPG